MMDLDRMRREYPGIIDYVEIAGDEHEWVLKGKADALIAALETVLERWKTVANDNIARAEAAERERDAIFDEFTGGMEDDAWEATMEWLRRDYPHLAERYKRD